VLLISDEIYDEFTYSESRTSKRPGTARPSPPAPRASPAPRTTSCSSALRQRLPAAPAGAWATPPVPSRSSTNSSRCSSTSTSAPQRRSSTARRDLRPRRERPHRQVSSAGATWSLQALDRHRSPYPGGAFYAFVQVPPASKLTASEFFLQLSADQASSRRPRCAFSSRDTHYRVSYAVKDEVLAEGLDILSSDAVRRERRVRREAGDTQSEERGSEPKSHAMPARVRPDGFLSPAFVPFRTLPSALRISVPSLFPTIPHEPQRRPRPAPGGHRPHDGPPG